MCEVHNTLKLSNIVQFLYRKKQIYNVSVGCILKFVEEINIKY